MKRSTYAALVLVTSLLAACGGSDGPTAPDNGGGGDRPAPSCHGAARSAGMDLRKGAARSNLVGVTSTGDPTQTRVIPGDAQNSYIVMKLEGRQTAGSRMPLGGAPLDNIDLTNIKNWINKGAKAN